MTVWTDNAARFAHRDRNAHVDQVLDAACRDTIGILRAGDQHAGIEARRVLAKAQRSASRVLGRSATW